MPASRRAADRNREIYGEHIAQNVFFHDIAVKMCQGGPGAVQNVADTSSLALDDSTRRWAEWQG